MYMYVYIYVCVCMCKQVEDVPHVQYASVFQKVCVYTHMSRYILRLCVCVYTHARKKATTQKHRMPMCE